MRGLEFSRRPHNSKTDHFNNNNNNNNNNNSKAFVSAFKILNASFYVVKRTKRLQNVKIK